MLVDNFLPYLLPDVPNCPPIIASRALMFAATEMCEVTQVWSDFIATPITLVDGTYIYAVTPPANAQVCALLEVYGPQGPLTGKTMAQVAQLLGNWQVATSSLPVYFNGTADNSQARFFPIPQNSNGAQLTLRAAFKPTLASTDIPDVLISQAHEGLLSGAKARLFVEPGKTWTNEKLGVYHEGKFNAACSDVRAQVLHENVGSELVATARPFGF